MVKPENEKNEAIKTERRLRTEIKTALEAAETIVRGSMTSHELFGDFLAVLASTYYALEITKQGDALLAEAIEWQFSSGRYYPSEVLAILLRANRDGEAEAMVNNWVRDRVTLGDYVFGRGYGEAFWGYVLAERYTEALGILRRWAQLDVGKDRSRNQAGQLNQAYTQLTEYVALSGDFRRSYMLAEESFHSGDSWAKVARVAAENDHDAEALYAIEKSEANSYDTAWWQSDLAEAQIALGNFEEAKCIFIKADAKKESNWHATYDTQVVRYFARTQQFEKAFANLEKMVSSDKTYKIAGVRRLNLEYVIAKGYLSANRRDDARALLLSIVERAKDNVTNRWELPDVAKTFAEMGYASDAIATYIAVYRAFINVGGPNEWFEVVTKAIQEQAKAGLAYDELPCK